MKRVRCAVVALGPRLRLFSAARLNLSIDPPNDSSTAPSGVEVASPTGHRSPRSCGGIGLARAADAAGLPVITC